MMQRGWWAYPPNRRRAGLAGGAGTVIAAISAGLIAGLSQHPSWTEPPTSHRVADVALNKPRTTADIKNAEHSAEATAATAIGTSATSAVTATSIPAPPLPQAPPAQAPPAQAPAAGADNIGTRPDEHAATQPAAASTTTDSAIPKVDNDGSTMFRPYTHNGPIGSATQTTSGPTGTTSITISPSRRAEHSTAQDTRATTSSSDHTNDRRKNPTPSDTDRHGTDHAAHELTDTAASGATGSTGSGPGTSGTTTSGATVYTTQPTEASTAEQASNPSDSQTQSRVAAALPPGFSPTAPRRTLSISPAPLPSAAPTSVPSSGLVTQSASPETVVDSTTPAGAGASPSGPVQPGPAQTGLGQSGAEPAPVSASNTRLIPVACPAAVANATCYQPAPVTSPTAPARPASPTGSTALSQAEVGSAADQGAGSGVPRISSAPGTEAPPTALPSPGSTQVAASAPATTSSGDCQASGNHTDAVVRAQNWGDLSQLIMDRIQDCLDQGMSSGSGSGRNTTTSSGIKKSHSSASTSGTSASTNSQSAGSGKHASTSGSDSPSATEKKQRHKD